MISLIKTSIGPTKPCATPGNGRQSVDLAFRVAELLQSDVMPGPGH